MKNIIKASLVLTIIAGLASCSEPARTESSVSGKYTFQVVTEGEGSEVKNGQYLVLDLKVIDNNDSVWFDRQAILNPMVILKDSAKWLEGTDGVYEIFNNTKKGDSLIVDLTVEDFFSNTVKIPAPPEAQSAENITMYWKVSEIFDYEAYYEYMMALEEDRMKSTTESENEPIAQYIAENGWEVSTTSPGGVRVIIHEIGEGPNAESGQRVSVDYAGYFLDGTLFDTSIEEVSKEAGQYSEGRPYQPYGFVIDQDAVIDGWHEGFKLLNKGTKATFIIPSALAYKDRGYPPVIPPNAILRFDVELVEIE